MTEEMYKECNYRFKGKSCKECPLGCVGKVDKLTRLEQENKELKEKITSLESEIRQKKMTIMMNNDHYLTVDENNRKYHSALEEIRDLCIHYENTNDKCVTNCYAHFIVTDLIQDKINECLGG